MSLVMGGKEIVGSGISPHIGGNGNWFVGESDTGEVASPHIFYTTKSKFETQTHEGIYFVYNNETNNVEIYHINNVGTKHLITDKSVIVPTTGANGNWFIGTTDTGIPISGDGSTIAGAAINDNTVDGSTVWSSYKLDKKFKDIEDGTVKGKSLEFDWDDTKLGVRLHGDKEYQYVDLQGHQGLVGLDGASIINARQNESGELILTIVDNETSTSPLNLLTFEDGVLTVGDIETIINTIKQLGQKVDALSDEVNKLKAELSK